MSRFRTRSPSSGPYQDTASGCRRMFVLALVLGVGWWNARVISLSMYPRPGDQAACAEWWDVPPESVYTFAFYIFQQLNRWPTNGEDDYARNIHVTAYLTPGCQHFLRLDYEQRQRTGNCVSGTGYLRNSGAGLWR